MSKPDPKELNTHPADYFSEAYQDVMYTGVIGFYSRLVHRLMERPFANTHAPIIVEVGAGAGQHAPFVQGSFDTYFQTDLDPTLASQGFPQDPRVVSQAANAEALSEFTDDSVDRVIATCLLAHLDHPERALEEWRRVTKPGGSISIYLPTEPGMLLRFLRHFAVAPKSKRHGQDHLSIVYRDHRNHYPGMKHMIKTVFVDDQVRFKRFPTRFLGWNFALFEIVQITVE